MKALKRIWVLVFVLNIGAARAVEADSDCSQINDSNSRNGTERPAGETETGTSDTGASA